MKPYTNNYIVTVLVFCIGLLPFAFVSAHESHGGDSLMIHMDEQGFHPKNVTISTGTTVVFKNTGKEKHWPASDRHPTHTAYDGTNLENHCNNENNQSFDACRGILTGETWSFTFKKTGTFSYHDHLWSHLAGEITVTGIRNSEKIKQIGFLEKVRAWLFNLFKSPNNKVDLNHKSRQNVLYQSLEKQYRKIVKQSNPGKAIRGLTKDAENDPAVEALCHDVMHEIGKTAYNKYGNLGEVFKYQSGSCNSGYIHGSFEAFAKSANKPIEGIIEQCDSYVNSMGRQIDRRQCYHGMGHGLMYATGGDLQKTLSLCRNTLKEGQSKVCQNGAFMEVFNLEKLAKEDDYVDPNKPFETCSNRSDTTAGLCHLYIPSYLSSVNDMSFTKIIKECKKSAGRYTSSCLQGVGAEAIKRNASNPKEVFKLCQNITAFSNKKICVRGIVGAYLSKIGEYRAGNKLCKQAPVGMERMCNNLWRSHKELYIRQNNP